MLAKEKAEAQADARASDCDILRDLNVRQDEGHVKHAFIMAFYFLLRYANGCTYELALRETIRQGGETDSNACAVGGLLGAAIGHEDIPVAMRRKVLEFDCAANDLLTPKRKRPEFLSLQTNFDAKVQGLIKNRAIGDSVQIIEK